MRSFIYKYKHTRYPDARCNTKTQYQFSSEKLRGTQKLRARLCLCIYACSRVFRSFASIPLCARNMIFIPEIYFHIPFLYIYNIEHIVYMYVNENTNSHARTTQRMWCFPNGKLSHPHTHQPPTSNFRQTLYIVIIELLYTCKVYNVYTISAYVKINIPKCRENVGPYIYFVGKPIPYQTYPASRYTSLSHSLNL